MLVYYFLPFIVNNLYLLFQVSKGHNSVTVQNRTHVHMNFFFRITYTIISQSSADSSWITLYILKSNIQSTLQVGAIFTTLSRHWVVCRCMGHTFDISAVWNTVRTLQFSPLSVLNSCIPCGSKNTRRFPSNFNFSVCAMENLHVSRYAGTERLYLEGVIPLCGKKIYLL